ncbi:hypothetical protein HY638_03160 [Candidatus Woesearchaeota archaeon]|nr:hypothetical protein [Candidatus Woesearchaeota archaeon]
MKKICNWLGFVTFTVFVLSIFSISAFAVECEDPETADASCFANAVVSASKTTECSGALRGHNANNANADVGADCDAIPDNKGKTGCARSVESRPSCNAGDGVLVLDMGQSDLVVNANSDWDIRVRESGWDEKYKAYVSNDLVNWVFIGNGCGNSEFNIPGQNLNEAYRYVKITANGNDRCDGGHLERDDYGADIDWVMGRVITAQLPNTAPILANIPDQTFVAGSGLQNNIVDLFTYASDAQDTDAQLSFAIISQSNTNVASCSVDSDRYVDCSIGLAIGSSDITIRATDTGGLTDTDVFRITTTPIGTLVITELECFPYVIANNEQDCSVYVVANNAPAGGAAVNLYEGATLLGTCTTNSISGGCDILYDVASTGDHTVYATATKAGYLPDNDGQPTFTYTVLTERYDIQDLKIFNDAGFSVEDNDFFRNENMYASFQVLDMFTNQFVTGVVTEVDLISSPGGRITLTQVAGLAQPDTFYYALTPIPPTHDFLGVSHVFAFSFNFTDASGGEERVDVFIRNNPPVITPPVPNIVTNRYTPVSLDLTAYEFDIEDTNPGLTWTITGVDASLYTASINSNDVLSVTPIAIGSDTATLTLTDLDGDVDVQAINVQIVPTQCEDGLDNDGDGLIDMNDPGCSSPQDDDESDGTSQCQDGINNDGDSATDYPADFSCSSPQDDDETLPRAQCQDSLDNDGDGLTDLNDPGCASDQDNDESNGTSECQDGIDNDNDGATDFPNDFSCSSPQDDDETLPRAQCQDAIDNDGDGLIDFPADPGCSSNQDNNEFNLPPPQCSDGADNDGDGLIDMNDPGCSSPQDDDESDGTSQCQDGVDNDGDGLIDMNDPGCSSPQDNDEFNVFVPQCQDGIDNDNDGLIDLNDPGCSGPNDNDESDLTTECQDGRDNDGDGLTDFPADPGCSSSQDDDEFNELPQRGLFVQSIRMNGFGDGIFATGDQIVAKVVLQNDKDMDLRHISITATVPELGMYSKVGPFPVDSGEVVTKTIILDDIPYGAEPGIYTARFSISNGLVTRVVHREIEIA